jgi:hypothetical protein
MGLELKQDGSKKAYEPPRLAMIDLRPEEAVLGACKSFSAAGSTSLSTCFVIGPCHSIGS